MRLSARKTKNENQITLSSLLKKKKKQMCFKLYRTNKKMDSLLEMSSHN